MGKNKGIQEAVCPSARYAYPYYIYAYEFRYYPYDFRAKMPRLSKRTPFGLQKDSFCTAKGLLLHSKRTTFGGQKESF